MRLVTAHRLLIGVATAGAALYGVRALVDYQESGAPAQLLGALGAGAGVVLLGVYYKVFVRRLRVGQRRPKI